MNVDKFCTVRKIKTDEKITKKTELFVEVVTK